MLSLSDGKGGDGELTDLSELERSLGISFQDPSLLKNALVHSSYLNENPDCPLADNERLEFLGDAVLGLVVAEELYRRYPAFSVGEMTRLRSALVCQDALARLARPLQLGDYLVMGRGEEASGGRSRESNLARAFEAVLGAIYLDGGIEATRRFLFRTLYPELERVQKEGEPDYKSRLQQLAQSRRMNIFYRSVKETGREHERRFTVEVVVEEVARGRGEGKSRKEAEQEAARQALQNLSP